MSPCVVCGTADASGGTLRLTVEAEAAPPLPAIFEEVDVEICRVCARRLADGQLLTGEVNIDEAAA